MIRCDQCRPGRLRACGLCDHCPIELRLAIRQAMLARQLSLPTAPAPVGCSAGSQR